MKLTVNGVPRSFEAPPLKRLLDVLREDLGLTGTKEGCGEGECGACSVLIDGELVNSCLVAVCQADGCSVLTVEGVARNGDLAPVQKCFLDRGGAQCGICTPGMIVAAHRFLECGLPATNENVREAIAGNLCRCTGYAKIVEAIQLAAGQRS
ncbi:MAG: (2Fe-2S)-binding protein [Myxococcales bacterium]|nr:(2Fe-2S)-binding protein [Myxococcales bacterium]